VHRGGEALHEGVDLEIEDARELDVGRDVAEGNDRGGAKLLQALALETSGTPTPIMQLRVTMPASRASSQRSVPLGRIGSTR